MRQSGTFWLNECGGVKAVVYSRSVTAKAASPSGMGKLSQMMALLAIPDLPTTVAHEIRVHPGMGGVSCHLGPSAVSGHSETALHSLRLGSSETSVVSD